MIRKGLVFYYDWLNQLLKLDDADFKETICAIVRYHRDGELPPAISSVADMAIGFILPQIDRIKEKAENGKLGGRPKKDEAHNGTSSNQVADSYKNIINNEEITEGLSETDVLMQTALDKKRRLDDSYARRHGSSDWAFRTK